MPSYFLSGPKYCHNDITVKMSGDILMTNIHTGAASDIVRVAVIGGMTMTGLWEQISRIFEDHSGYKVDVVASGPRPVLAKVFRQGKADILTMHSGDITTNLVADGYGLNLRPWTQNELVILGPSSDPAGICGMKDGAEAFWHIAREKASFVDFLGVGSREVCHRLWREAGVSPGGEWILKDESGGHVGIVEFARRHNAYVVVGRMPVLFGKFSMTGMEIMVEGDKSMRRPYVVMEADAKRFPRTNVTGAEAFSDFLIGDEIQKFLEKFGLEHGGLPLFYPVVRN